MVYHVVGIQGVGKSTLIRLLAADFQRRGRVCAGQDPCVFSTLDEAQAEQPGADVYFIEHLSMETVNAGPGHFIINMSRTPAAHHSHTAQAAQQGAANA